MYVIFHNFLFINTLAHKNIMHIHTYICIHWKIIKGPFLLPLFDFLNYSTAALLSFYTIFSKSYL